MVNGLTRTIHYTESNPGGDYTDVTIDLHLDGIHYQTEWGDSYHDKGWERSDGFIDAIRMIYGEKFPIIDVEANDREDID